MDVLDVSVENWISLFTPLIKHQGINPATFGDETISNT